MTLSSCILGKTASQILTHLMAVKNDGPALKSLRCSGPYYDRDPTSDHHFHHLSYEEHKRILEVVSRRLCLFPKIKGAVS